MREEQVAAGPIKMTAVITLLPQRYERAADSLPLLNKAAAVMGVGHRQGLRQDGGSGMRSVAKSHAQSELGALGQVNLRHHRHVTVLGPVKLPVHLHVVVQVLPAVAEAHEPAGAAQESVVAAQSQVSIVFPGQQYGAS